MSSLENQRILCTFPGRAGDLLWALPTVRAISESLGYPVDLQIAGEFEGMLELLRLQPYLGHCSANPHWDMTQGWAAPMPVGTPERTYERGIHLGYRRWPEEPLPIEVYTQCRSTQVGLPLPLVDLTRPWITVKDLPARQVAVGWTDCYFELKYGLMELVFEPRIKLSEKGLHPYTLVAPGSRWATEGGYSPTDWLEAARRIAGSEVFLGDCSALHVLAVALGKPCVIYEPMEARWNPIFYPLGKVGPQVTLVVGNDGLPTQDARHTAETLKAVLNAR